MPLLKRLVETTNLVVHTVENNYIGQTNWLRRKNDWFICNNESIGPPMVIG